jgi:hypothetical protein
MLLDYDDLAKALRDIDERDDVVVTVVQGGIFSFISTPKTPPRILFIYSFEATGKWFCACVPLHHN